MSSSLPADPIDAIQEFLAKLGLADGAATLVAHVTMVLLVALVALIANFVVKRIIIRAVTKVISKTDTKYDDYFLQYQVFDRLSHLAPALVIYAATPLALPGYSELQQFVHRLVVAYMIAVGAFSLSSLLNALVAAYRTLGVSRNRPIKSYVQVLKIFLFLVTAILIISVLMNRSPWVFLSGLGALTAVLMLVFKDSILGLVASIQITQNDMVRIGDWIEMPKAGADGDVIDINLTTVKIQNWDKTISTVPTYDLIAQSFKNWRGMSESGGRRIKRSLNIDMNTVRFCDKADLERFRRIQVLEPYLDARVAEVEAWNGEHQIDPSEIVNGRRLTNLGTFRAYVVAYLKRHPKIHKDMTFLVRQLAPTEHGVPIEIYVFSNDQVWANYEEIQSDIFDHLLASIPEFGLRVFQNPSGADVGAVAQAVGGHPH